MGNVPLPNEQWVRSTKQPNWSLCLDPDSAFFGWKMYECNDNWVTGAKLTLQEVEQSLDKKYPELSRHVDHLIKLKDILQK